MEEYSAVVNIHTPSGTVVVDNVVATVWSAELRARYGSAIHLPYFLHKAFGCHYTNYILESMRPLHDLDLYLQATLEQLWRRV